MAVMTVWAAVLITYGFSTGTAMDSGKPGMIKVIQLDMAPHSVDDMYDGCKKEMESSVKKYLANEKDKDKKFDLAWGLAEEYYNKNWKEGKQPYTSLGKEQIMAIHAYTLKEPNLYRDFNDAVRSQGSEYRTKFMYHTLHFFLTDAIQTLNAHKPEKERCVTGYRGVNLYFSQDVVNKEIRFGSFTSTSTHGYDVALRFGNKSCFEILTCFGADISIHSKFKEEEAEVLVPPYEVFKVTKVLKKSAPNTLPCEVVYKLTSTRTLSNLNCSLFKK